MVGNSALNAGELPDAQTRGQATPTPTVRILVVDDDPVFCLLSAAVLAHSGYQVDTAEDGESGWEALHARNYDLLITDNNMPRVSGLELVERLRCEAAAPPVILVSGAIPPNELQQHPGLQLAAMLAKPFTGEELLRTVEEVLHNLHGAREQMEPLPPWRSQLAAHG